MKKLKMLSDLCVGPAIFRRTVKLIRWLLNFWTTFGSPATSLWMPQLTDISALCSEHKATLRVWIVVSVPHLWLSFFPFPVMLLQRKEEAIWVLYMWLSPPQQYKLTGNITHFQTLLGRFWADESDSRTCLALLFPSMHRVLQPWVRTHPGRWVAGYHRKNAYCCPQLLPSPHT